MLFLCTAFSSFAGCHNLSSSCRQGDPTCDLTSLLLYTSVLKCDYKPWVEVSQYQRDPTDTKVEVIDHIYYSGALYGLMWREIGGNSTAGVVTSNDNGLTYNQNTAYLHTGLTTKPTDFAILSNGTIFMTVDANPGGVKTWLTVKSTDGGASWTTSDQFVLSGGQPSRADRIVAVNDSLIFTFGIGNDSTNENVVVRRTTDGGGSWSTVFTFIDSPVANTYFKTIDYSNGVFYMTSLSQGTNNIFYHRSTDGVNWNNFFTLNTPCCAVGADKHGPRDALVTSSGEILTINWTGSSLLDWSIESVRIDGSNYFQSDFVSNNPNITAGTTLMQDADSRIHALGATGPGNPDTIIIRTSGANAWSTTYSSASVLPNTNLINLPMYMDPAFNLYFSVQDNNANPNLHVYKSSCN
ncbi:MAG: exo-alpha-sialidase [Leptospiraceae bacterium]|nr:exo-alpha-sialidase [Leptospiraceae bacterium]